MSIRENINFVNNKLASLSSDQVILVCVTKGRSVGEIKQAIEAGVTIIGENRVQEAEKKFTDLLSSVKKHLIGHLQSNKIKKAIRLFDVIQSVDSLELAEKISRECKNSARRLEIFLQVNISEDPKKFGFLSQEFPKILKKIVALPSLKLSGLMTILENSADDQKTRHDFRKMKKLFDECQKVDIPGLELKYLSMGMSGDFEIAAEEGSTMVRIGSRIFE